MKNGSGIETFFHFNMGNGSHFRAKFGDENRRVYIYKNKYYTLPYADGDELEKRADGKFYVKATGAVYTDKLMDNTIHKDQEDGAFPEFNLGGVRDKAGAEGKSSITGGIGANAKGERGISLGFYSQASKFEAVAIGKNTKALGNQSLAIGNDVVADGERTFVMGSRSYTGKGFDVVDDLKSTGKNGIAIGSGNSRKGDIDKFKAGNPDAELIARVFGR